MKREKLKRNILEAKKIAIIRTDRLGDMVLTLPLARLIKINIPQAEVTLITRTYVADLIKGIDVIDRVRFIDQESINKILQSEKYDVIFNPRITFNEVLAEFIHRIPVRIGSAYRAYSFLLNGKIYEHRKEGNFHEAEFNCRMLSEILEIECDCKLVEPKVDIVSLQKIKAILERNNITRKFIIIHPGSGGSSIDWSLEKFLALSQLIDINTSYQIVLTGNEAELDKCNFIANSNSNAINLCNKLNLKELIALISLSEGMIANSTGVIHLSASFNKKNIGLYPNSNHLSAKRWGPYNKNSLTISPKLENFDNMETISEIEVFEKFQSIFNT